MNVQEAIDFGRFHHQWLPYVIAYQRLGLSPDTLEALSARGHALRETRSQGAAQGIVIDSAHGLLEGGYDRRAPDSLAVGGGSQSSRSSPSPPGSSSWRSPADSDSEALLDGSPAWGTTASPARSCHP